MDTITRPTWFSHGQHRSAAMHEHGGHGHEGEVDDQHAFVMLGQQTLFLTHLTMYGMDGHNYQLVLRARLSPDVMRRFDQDRTAHPDSTYFLGNSPEDQFTIPDITSGDRPEFKADIFRGIPQVPEFHHWPWKDQTPTIPAVTLSVERVVFFRQLAKHLEPPPKITYALFGAGNEAHMVSYQAKRPDFDQVVSLAEAPSWLTETQLKSGVLVSIDKERPPGMTLCSDPLPASGQSCIVKYRGDGPDREIKIGHHHMFCTKIANMPGSDPCGALSFPCGSPP